MCSGDFLVLVQRNTLLLELFAGRSSHFENLRSVLLFTSNVILNDLSKILVEVNLKKLTSVASRRKRWPI